MRILVSMLLLFGGVWELVVGQYSEYDTEVFSEYDGPPSQSYHYSTESSYSSDDDDDYGSHRSYRSVDPTPSFTKSRFYISPEDVYDSLIRDKRDTSADYDYTKTYRDFVRENFGLDDAKALSEEDDEYDDDSGDRAYEKVKEYSEKQAEESKKNPEFCKLVYKDGKECTVCRNPKTNAHSETCSYSSKPKPKKYAYKRERNYNSKRDNDDDYEEDHEEEASQKDERQTPRESIKQVQKHSKQLPIQKPVVEIQDDGPVPIKVKSHKKGKARRPVPRQTEEYYEGKSFEPSKPFEETRPYTTGGKVDKVLDDFKKRDWSKCKRKSKKGLTCYYCKDEKGASHEECMYVSNENPDPVTHHKEFEEKEEVPQQRAAPRPTRRTQRQTEAARSTGAPKKPTDAEGSATEQRTIQRTVAVKIHENGDSEPAASKSVFYKKVTELARK